MCSWQDSLHLLHRPLLSHSQRTDFPLPSPRTSGKSVKGVLCSLCLCTNTQQSSRTTDEHKTGSWNLLAWQEPFILFGAQQTKRKLSATPNNQNCKGYKNPFFQISVWPRIGKYAVCRVSLMKQRAHEISTGPAPRWDTKI